MKTKLITTLIAFATTFGFSTLMMEFVKEKRAPQTHYLTTQIRYHSETEQKILKLLRQDIKNGLERRSKLSHMEDVDFSTAALLNDYAEATAEYAYKSSSIDETGIPADFQFAWRRHMKAWRDYADFLDETRNLSENQRREMDLDEMDFEKSLEINQSWREVLRTARKYGASLSRY
ncbi:MAG TPA: hypothetical protein VEX64_05290 [Pyrinomonadaceae bacterium]|nr:hypothetical protein [Pyrinomonadaceae bacterium]